jgi:hypothetical protein
MTTGTTDVAPVGAAVSTIPARDREPKVHS